MAKVSLRIYNNEIGTLVDQGHTDEAIGHCYHILKTFPKHLETYKLLGKAYLETKKYEAAKDIFSRVLMSVPNDFVSHVGMSLIADENEKMDDAIWHMQRAFEVQASNAAVQGELQRLYGRRDGVQPPKVRMTSGALANVYVQGELYPQALAEILSVEAQDPGRLDMQVLLANTYFLSGQRVKASEIASSLLVKYPYCFDANRILVEILPETSRAESAEVYRQRVNALDPYAAFAKGSIFKIDEVPDASISLERLDWHPGDTPQLESGWSDSMGISEDKDKNEEPDWLKEDGNAPDPKGDSLSKDSPEEGIPDFMREAGWGNSSGEEEPTSFFDSSAPEEKSDDGDGAEEIEEGEMPDWMKSIAPAPEEIAADENDLGDEEGTDEWISDLLGEDAVEETVAEKPAAESPESEAVIDDALIGALGTSEDDQDAAMNWLENLAVNQGAKAEELITDPNARTEDAPEWVKKSQEVSSEEVEESSAIDKVEEDAEETPATDEVEEDSDAMPAWLKDEEEPAAEKAEDIPAWLDDSKEETPVSEDIETPATESDDEYAWLNDMSADEEVLAEEPAAEVAPAAEETATEESPISDPAIGALGTSADDQDAAMNWLESLAANQGAKAEELITDPDARTEDAPEWVKKSQEVSAESEMLEETSESAPVEDAQPVVADEVEEETPVLETEASPNIEEETLISDPAIGDLGASADDQDAAMNWLESLAANQGAKAEELITDPNARTEDAPEWVKKSQEASAESEALEETSESAPVEDQPVAEDVDATPAWLEDEVEEETPEWVEKAKDVIDEEPPAPEAPLVVEEKTEEIAMPDIASLEEEEAPQVEPEPILSESEGEADDAPTWIKEMDDSASESLPPAAEPAPVSDEEDLPGWLADMEAAKKEEVKSEESEDEALPDWMATEEVDPPAEPLPTQPSEWQPAEAVAEEATSSEKAEDASVEEEKTFGSVAEKLAKEGALPRKGTVAKKEVELKKPVEPEPKEEVEEAPELPVKKKKRSKRRMDTTMLRDINLMGAQAALDEGNISAALEEYSKLIKKNRLLDETIFDLREALDDYPVNIEIWQMLGDAYMRAGRLQEAIDSYTNAEKLLR
ncbi:MAG: tetratricopeptide repeat protein [Chloroflexi bacterium]|nr:tetratricopeptide repeat protein [Chloroflexota bacterium]